MLSFVSVNLFAIFLLWLLLNKMAQTIYSTCRVSSLGCCFLSLPPTGEVILKYLRIVNNTFTLLNLESEFHSENLRNTGFTCDFSYPFSRPNFPFGQKNQNCLCKTKFGTQTNSNMLNWMVLFKSSLLGRKYLFCAILVRKNKIICLRLKLATRLIQLYWIWW